MRNRIQSLQKKDNVDKIIAWFIVSIMAIILFYNLIASPALGKADNGDFGRMSTMVGVADMAPTYEEQFDYYFHQEFKLVPSNFLMFWKPDVVIGCYVGKIAVILNYIFNFFNTSTFDIRYLGAIYSIIFLTGMYFIMRYERFTKFTKVVCGILGILIFTDGIYISYFNSFFGEAATISGLFLVIGSFLNLVTRKEPAKKDFVFFFVSSFFFLTSKSQQLPLIIFIWIIYYALYKFYKEHKRLIIVSTLIITTLCGVMFLSISEFTNKNNIYQAVFTGVLYDSETPEEDLKELGLNEKFAANAGPGVYAKDLKYDPLGDEMLEEFYPNISLGKVLGFYIRHPKRAWEKISSSADYAYSFYEIDEYNYPKGEYNPDKFINKFRYKLIERYPEVHRNIYLFIGFAFIYVVVLIIYFFRSKKNETKLLTLLLLFLLAAGASQLVLPVIGSGVADFGKHLFLINLSYDILVCSSILWSVNIGCEYFKGHIRNRKNI